MRHVIRLLFSIVLWICDDWRFREEGDVVQERGEGEREWESKRDGIFCTLVRMYNLDMFLFEIYQI